MKEVINNSKIKESLIVRGVCSAVQAMNLPTINNILDLFSKGGIKLKKNNT